MPFGVRDPLKYTRPGRTVVYPDDLNFCPICAKHLDLPDSGVTPVAPCPIPHTDLDGCDLTIVFGCSACYSAQNRLKFVTLKELVEYRTRKTAVKAKRKEPKKAVGRPRKSAVSLSEDDLVLVRQIFDLASKLLNDHGSKTETIGRCDTEESDMSRRAMNQDLPEDDIEFGMTEDQKRRMDKAVHDSSERTKLVPSEAWNGKTSAEILQLDKNGLPHGW